MVGKSSTVVSIADYRKDKKLSPVDKELMSQRTIVYYVHKGVADRCGVAGAMLLSKMENLISRGDRSNSYIYYDFRGNKSLRLTYRQLQILVPYYSEDEIIDAVRQLEEHKLLFSGKDDYGARYYYMDDELFRRMIFKGDTIE